MNYRSLTKRLHPDFWTPGRKPIGPVEIDRSHPIGRRVSFCAYPGSIVDIASGMSRTLTGQSSDVSTNRGIAMRTTQAGGIVFPGSSVAGFYYSGHQVGPSGAASMFFVARRLTIDTNSGAFIGHEWSSSAYEGINATFDTDHQLYYQKGIGTRGGRASRRRTLIVTGVTVTDTDWHSYSVTFGYGDSNHAYFDREERDFTVSGTYTGPPAYRRTGLTDFYIGDNITYESMARDLDVLIVLLFDDELTPEEHLTLHNNPFIVLKPSSQYIWMPKAPSVQVTRLSLFGVPVRKYATPTMTIVSLTADNTVLIEYKESYSADKVYNLETLLKSVSSDQTNVEYLQKTSNSFELSIETFLKIIRGLAIPTENKQDFYTQLQNNVETLSTAIRSASISLESLLKIVKDNQIPTSWLSDANSLSVDRILLVEWLATVLIDKTLNTENQQTLQTDKQINTETLESIISTLQEQIETLLQLTTSVNSNVEILSSISDSKNFNVSNLQLNSTEQTMNVESQIKLQLDRILEIEELSQFQKDLQLESEILQNVLSSYNTLIEYLQKIRATSHIPTEWSGTSISIFDRVLSIEYTQKLLRDIQINIGHSASLSEIKTFFIENNSTILSEAALHLEILTDIVRDNYLNLETLIDLLHSDNLRIEHLVQIEKEKTLDIYHLETDSIDIVENIEYAMNLSFSEPMRIETLTDFISGNETVLIEELQKILYEDSINISNSETNNYDKILQIDIRSVWTFIVTSQNVWKLDKRDDTWTVSPNGIWMTDKKDTVWVAEPNSKEHLN